MTSHISELQGNIVTRISAGGSLQKNKQFILSRGSRILRARTALGSRGRLRSDVLLVMGQTT